MNLNSSRKSYLLLYILVGLLVLFLILPIKIPYTIKVPGKIVSSKEWIIARGTDGRLITILADNTAGMNRNYSVSQFERGDAIQFLLRPDITTGKAISMNDTVGSIYSNEIDRQIISLSGELQTARRSLAVYTSGEKTEVVNELSDKLQYMKTQAQEQRKIFDRQKALYEKNLISQEEYDIAKGTADLNAINISIAEAQLRTAQTGDKQEQIDYIKAQIESLQNELDVLVKRTNAYTLTSQVSGVARRITSPDTLLIISDTSEYVSYMPVKWEDKTYIRPGQTVLVKYPAAKLNPSGKILRLEKGVYNLNGRQVFFSAAGLKRESDELVPGLMVECTIQCDPVTPIEYIKRLFQ